LNPQISEKPKNLSKNPFIPRVATLETKNASQHHCCSSACKKVNESAFSNKIYDRKFTSQLPNSPVLSQKQAITQERERTWSEYRELVSNFKQTQSHSNLIVCTDENNSIGLNTQHIVSVNEFVTQESKKPRYEKRNQGFLRTCEPKENDLSNESYESKLLMRDNILQQLTKRHSNQLCCELEQLTPIKNKGKKPIHNNLHENETENIRPKSTKNHINNGPSIAERSLLWKKVRDKKLTVMRNEYEENSIKECTFRPRRITEDSVLAREYEKSQKYIENPYIIQNNNKVQEIYDEQKNSYAEMYKCRKKVQTPTANIIKGISPTKGYSSKREDCRKFLFQ